ncbi:ATP-dependent DNA helicase [Granulosicoccus sp. 3-233]|uniref:ATP-dependent DNA helicase n=1 Tax=Granulosicoccus sp. 3-233 TaxID=3417969 RepID=UPI003D34193F
MDMIDSITDVLGQDGPIARHLKGFAPRAEQQHLAEAIFSTLEKGSVLVGEAGTGTGKTFAYLVPAILSGQRIIISTGTRHLQDQLFYSDLPLIKKALSSGVSTSLLKGRANYLCKHRLERAMRNPALLDEKHQQHLRLIADWARRTTTGDIAEVMNVPEDSMAWSFVVSNIEFCSKHEFEDLEDCYVHHARKKAQESDIVVINHHLLSADLALKEQGFGELLPSANGFVIDEAHQLPDIAAQFFGHKFSSRQILDLARDTVGEQLHEAPDMRELRDLAQELETGIRHFRLAFPIEPGRDAWVTMKDTAAIERELERLTILLGSLEEALAEGASRGKGLESCHKRALQHAETLKRFVQNPADGEYVHWYETFRNGFSLNMTPMTVATPFQKAMEAMTSSWVFTSATLAVGGDFSHFSSQLGLEDCRELQVDSPFDYRHNALLYLPEGLPEPQHATYTSAIVEKIKPVLQASEGRAFLLFTSYRALHEAERLLEGQVDYPILVQGQMPKRELIEAFQAVGNAVLLGTSSFWEGVDVRGDALSLVVIDKLPFGSPGDPVMSARIDHMKRAGGNPFFEFQMPQAAIALKQGVGRLIRDVTDRGVLMLCDPRIRSRHYGEVFITSLPPMPITRGLDEVQEFYQSARQVLDEEVAQS